MLAIYLPVEAYIKSKQKLWSATTLTTARYKLRTCVLLQEDLNPDKLYDKLSESHSLYSIRTLLITAAQFENWSKGTHHIKDFMQENAFLFRTAYQEKESRMSEEDFKKCLLNSKTPEEFNLLILLGHCGLRKHEALKAEWSDLDQTHYVLRVKGKGKKVRHVPLNPLWLEKPSDQTQLLIAGPKGLGHRYFIERTGFTFIDFRAYFATKVANHPELGIRDAQMLLGHSSVVTTQKYVRPNKEKAHLVLMKGAPSL